MYPETIETTNPMHVVSYDLEDGGKIHVLYDQDAESPREWEPASTMVSMDYRSSIDGDPALESLAGNYGALTVEEMKMVLETDPDVDTDDMDSDMAYFVGQFATGRKVAAMDSFTYGDRDYGSGIAVIFQDEFDAAGYGATVSPAEVLRSEIEAFQAWANGEVYVVMTTNADGEVIDSVGGVYLNPFDEDEVKSVL